MVPDASSAKESGRAIADITAETTKYFHEDMASLGALPPTHEPRATQYIVQMVEMIQSLVKRGHAYAADGHVLFSVSTDKDYGKLSNRNREEMIAGARVEVAPFKKDPADFVLWKPSTPDLPGWDSPWGRGRPGWHIECSAMSRALLGEQFDIHGGGLDLIFPHHENEIAQSECYSAKQPLAKYWMHNGYLVVNGEKMSKSLGNFFTVRDVLKKAPGEVIRLALLMTHYRQPLDWTDDLLQQAKGLVGRLYTVMSGFNGAAASAISPEILTALGDDLNTPLAIRHLHRLTNDIAHAKSTEAAATAQAQLKADAQLLGLLGKTTEQWEKGDISADEAKQIEQLIADRKAARVGKDFARADEIRRELEKRGVVLEDSGKGTTWRRA
jgi:cysteinyl-tRNA synthetase